MRHGLFPRENEDGHGAVPHQAIEDAFLLFFIAAAVITPTGDPVNMTIFAAPMMVLYGLSIVIAWIVVPSRANEDRDQID